MVSRGEVALIVAQKGSMAGLIAGTMFPAVVLVVIVEKGTPPGVPFCCLKLYCLKKVEYLTRIAVTECNSGNDRNIVTDLHAGQDLMHSCTLYACSDDNAVVLGAGKGYSSFFGLNIRKAAGRKLIRQLLE